MSLDIFGPGRIYSSLRRCNCNANEVVERFVPEKDRVNMDDLADRIDHAKHTSDYRRAPPFCYSGMILAVRAQDIAKAFEHLSYFVEGSGHR